MKMELQSSAYYKYFSTKAQPRDSETKRPAAYWKYKWVVIDLNERGIGQDFFNFTWRPI